MRKIIAVLGLVILIAGVGTIVFLNSLGQKALSLDRYDYKNLANQITKFQYDSVGNLIATTGNTEYTYDSANQSTTLSNPLYGMNVEVSKRTITENESTSITIFLSNQSAKPYAETITLLAPNFSSNPSATSKKLIVPVGQKSASATWILTPQKTGSYELGVTSLKSKGTVVLGIVVTNVLGLTPLQAQILAYIGSAFGPILTVPWWLEVWQKRKKNLPARSRRKKR